MEVNFLPLPGMDQSGHVCAADLSLESEESDQEDCDSGDEAASVHEVLVQDDETQDGKQSNEEQKSAALF